MREIKKRIKSAVAAQVFSRLLSGLGRVSNQRLVQFTNLAEKIVVHDDPVVKAVLSGLKQYFREDHPGVELARRILRNLNPKCKKALVKTFFVSAFFKSANENKKFFQEEGFIPPWFLVLSPTMRCNLNCVGCSTRLYSKEDDLPIPLIDRLLNEAKELGIHFIVTQGGEMFVYKEMLDLYRKHKDIYFQVYTNGTLIDPAMAKTLARLGNVAPMISLEGFRETTDRRRGSGVFDKAMRAMDNLKAAGCFFGASVTQTRQNTQEIISEEFFRLLLEKGCYAVWFFQFLPIGKDPDTDLMATPAQRLCLREKVSAVRARLPIFVGDFWNDGPFVGGCIAAGRIYLHISNKGDIEPCAFAHFAVDNIKKTTLRKALNSDFFRLLRKQQPFGNGNLLAPCMIIDHPEIFRQAITETGAYPTHAGAEVIFEERVSRHLDAYASQMQQLTQNDWEKLKDKCFRWPS